MLACSVFLCLLQPLAFVRIIRGLREAGRSQTAKFSNKKRPRTVFLQAVLEICLEKLLVVDPLLMFDSASFARHPSHVLHLVPSPVFHDVAVLRTCFSRCEGESTKSMQASRVHYTVSCLVSKLSFENAKTGWRQGREDLFLEFSALNASEVLQKYCTWFCWVLVAYRLQWRS